MANPATRLLIGLHYYIERTREKTIMSKTRRRQCTYIKWGFKVWKPRRNKLLRWWVEANATLQRDSIRSNTHHDCHDWIVYGDEETPETARTQTRTDIKYNDADPLLGSLRCLSFHRNGESKGEECRRVQNYPWKVCNIVSTAKARYSRGGGGWAIADYSATSSLSLL